MEDSNTFFDFLQNYFHQTSESQRIGMCFVERETAPLHDKEQAISYITEERILAFAKAVPFFMPWRPTTA